VSDVGWAVATQLSTPRGEGEAVSGTSWRSEGCTTRVEVPGSIFRLERFLRGGPSGLIAQTEEGRDRKGEWDSHGRERSSTCSCRGRSRCPQEQDEKEKEEE
jgi:hypothetical protein